MDALLQRQLAELELEAEMQTARKLMCVSIFVILARRSLLLSAVGGACPGHAFLWAGKLCSQCPRVLCNSGTAPYRAGRSLHLAMSAGYSSVCAPFLALFGFLGILALWDPLVPRCGGQPVLTVLTVLTVSTVLAKPRNLC